MGISIESDLVIGRHYSDIDKKVLDKKALEYWCQDTNRKTEYETLQKVIAIDPKRQYELERYLKDVKEHFEDELFYGDEIFQSFTRVCEWYDADSNGWIIGFSLGGVIEIEQLQNADFVADVAEKAEKFKNYFGVEAKLIASQDVT